MVLGRSIAQKFTKGKIANVLDADRNTEYVMKTVWARPEWNTARAKKRITGYLNESKTIAINHCSFQDNYLYPTNA